MSKAEYLSVGNATIPSEGLIFVEGLEIVESIKNKLDKYIHLSPCPLTSGNEQISALGVNASIHPFRIPKVEDPYCYVANLVEILKSTMHLDESSALILRKVLYTLAASHKDPSIDVVREMMEEEAGYLTGIEYTHVRRLESILMDMTVGTFGASMKEDKLEVADRMLVTIPDEFPIAFRYVPLAIVLLRLIHTEGGEPVILSDAEGYIPGRSNVLREERAVMFERVSYFMRLFDILLGRRGLLLVESSSATLVAPEILLNAGAVLLRKPRIDAETRIFESFRIKWEALAPDDIIVLNPRENVMAKKLKAQSLGLQKAWVQRSIPIQTYSIEPVLKRLFGDKWSKALDILKFVRDSQPLNIETLETYVGEKTGETKTLRTLISIGMLQTSRSLRGITCSLTTRGEKAIAEMEVEGEEQ